MSLEFIKSGSGLNVESFDSKYNLEQLNFRDAKCANTGGIITEDMDECNYIEMNAISSSIVDISTFQDNSFIPRRSPMRPISSTNTIRDKSVDSYVSSRDSGSFECNPSSSLGSFEDSIFSHQEEILNNDHCNSTEENFLNLDGIDDIDAFLEEINIDECGNSNVVYNVDELVQVLLVHHPSESSILIDTATIEKLKD
ncbi:uncharacterized protein PRCAT00003884001 [Priceomyces carsonii]|uniref:uncharacterized protein n=1 Tax=Priceomyces carsonii TaxID=28549 RepID=UPI002ED8068A|nr:unnamed protein product [Priceomyces carsonii]